MGLSKWLKRRLRAWLLEEPIANNDLELIIDGRIERATAVQAAGLQLVCLIKSTKQERLISPSDCRSEGRFWKVWHQITGSQLSWADGTPCNPEEIDLI